MTISSTKATTSKSNLIYNLKSHKPIKQPLEPPPLVAAVKDDTVSISDEAKALFNEDKEKFLGINNYSQDELDAMLESHKAATDDSNSPLKTQLLCFKIAMRIIGGDNVPSKDMAFLAEHEPGMLSRAILLRRQNKDPKDHKSLLADEKSDGTKDTSSPLPSSGSEGAIADLSATDEIEVSVDVEA